MGSGSPLLSSRRVRTGRARDRAAGAAREVGALGPAPYPHLHGTRLRGVDRAGRGARALVRMDAQRHREHDTGYPEPASTSQNP